MKVFLGLKIYRRSTSFPQNYQERISSFSLAFIHSRRFRFRWSFTVKSVKISVFYFCWIFIQRTRELARISTRNTKSVAADGKRQQALYSIVFLWRAAAVGEKTSGEFVNSQVQINCKISLSSESDVISWIICGLVRYQFVSPKGRFAR